MRDGGIDKDMRDGWRDDEWRDGGMRDRWRDEGEMDGGTRDAWMWLCSYGESYSGVRGRLKLVKCKLTLR